MRPFLRGAHATLHPTAAPDAPAPAGPRAWLDAGPAAPGQDEIFMEARLPDGAPFALVGLAAIDWIERTARLCAGPLDATAAPPAAAPGPLADALGLVLRYARDELALERIEAQPGPRAPLGLLDALGFAPAAEGQVAGALRVLDFPDPLERR